MLGKISCFYISITAFVLISGFVTAFQGSGVGADIFVYDPDKEVIPSVYLIAVGSNEMKGAATILKYAESDSEAFATEMAKRVSYRINSGANAGKGKIHIERLAGSAVTKESILATLDSAARQINASDIFIFHFAGAGNKLDSGDFYLATSTFDHSAKDDAAELSRNGLTGEVLKSYFSRIRAKTKVLIFDTGVSEFVCDQGDSFFSQRQSISLFIGTRNLSFDKVKDKEHGTVTGVLLDAIRGGADSNYDGKITAWETLAFFGNVKYDEKRDKQTERDVKFCTSTQGSDFDLTFTDRRLEETVARLRPSTSPTPTSAAADRGESFLEGKPSPTPKKHEGRNYAVLFAFDQYDSRWTPLANPKNDTRDIAFELENKYKFKEVLIKENLTIAEFEAFIKNYQTRTFAVDDQVFFFIAGHGTANEYNNGFLVAKDSPGIFDKRSKGYFISLDEMLSEIDAIRSKHIMVVFDACFAGRVWRPAFTLIKSDMASNDTERRPAQLSGRSVFAFYPGGTGRNWFDDKLTKDEMISRELSERSRVVLTSGWDVVSDGKPGTNSPFAKQFITALRKAPDENGLVTLTDIMSYVKRVKNKTPPELGRIDKLGGKNTGGFVFCQGGCGTVSPASSR